MDLNNLRRKSDFLQHDAPQWCRTVWARIESLNHFLKTHKARLAAAGAIVRIGREWMIEIELFPSVAREILGLPESSLQ